MELFITKLYGLNFLVLQIHFKMVDETIFGHLSHCIVLVPSLLFKPEFLFNKKLFDSIQTFRYQWCIVIYLFLKVWAESKDFLLNKNFKMVDETIFGHLSHCARPIPTFQTRTRRSCWQTNSQRLRLLLLLLLMMLAHMRRSSFKLAEILGKAAMLIYRAGPNEGFWLGIM